MKKSKNLLSLRLLALALLLPTPLHAFYSPATGRWLSRDPIGEAGFFYQSRDSAENHKSDRLIQTGRHAFKSKNPGAFLDWLNELALRQAEHRAPYDESETGQLARRVQASYDYAQNDSVNAIDHLGLFPIIITGPICANPCCPSVCVMMGHLPTRFPRNPLLMVRCTVGPYAKFTANCLICNVKGMSNNCWQIAMCIWAYW